MSEYYSSDDDNVAGSSFLSRAKGRISNKSKQNFQPTANVSSQPGPFVDQSQVSEITKEQEQEQEITDANIGDDTIELEPEIDDYKLKESKCQENQQDQVVVNLASNIIQVSNSDVLFLQSQIDSIQDTLYELKNIIDQIVETVQTLTTKPARKKRVTKPKLETPNDLDALIN